MSPNKNESVRLFKNPVLEFFTHIHPLVPILVYSPLIVFFASKGFTTHPLWIGLASFATGVFLWITMEYAMHRFIFHYEPKTDFGKWAVYLLHGVHHDHPRDSTRLVMPLLVSVPLALTSFTVFRFLFGSYTPTLYAGLVFGYLAYDCLHYASHHFSMKGKIFSSIKSHHLRHHYSNPEKNFGLSNPLWDYFFGTKIQDTKRP